MEDDVTLPPVLSIYPPDWDEENRSEIAKIHNIPTGNWMRNHLLQSRDTPEGMTLEEWAAMLDWSSDMGRCMKEGKTPPSLTEWVDALENPPTYLVEWVEDARKEAEDD